MQDTPIPGSIQADPEAMAALATLRRLGYSPAAVGSVMEWLAHLDTLDTLDTLAHLDTLAAMERAAVKTYPVEPGPREHRIPEQVFPADRLETMRDNPAVDPEPGPCPGCDADSILGPHRFSCQTNGPRRLVIPVEFVGKS